MNQDLLEYVLNLDDADERCATEARLRSDPDAAKHVVAMRKFVEILAADQEQPAPPPDLVARTIGHVAEYACRHEPPPVASEPLIDDLMKKMTPERWRDVAEVLDRASAPGRGRRADWIVAGSIFAIAVGLLFAGIPYLRHRRDLAACQDQMRQMYGAFEEYADLHDGKYPQIGEKPPYLTAGSYLPILRDSGTLPSNAIYSCPAAQPNYPAGYAYSLGYRDQNEQIVGLRHEDSEVTDNLAVLADRPAPERVGPNPDHGYGQNVLYMGGNVRFSTTTLAGPNGDDIYRNKIGMVAAGRSRDDVVLGVGPDVP